MIKLEKAKHYATGRPTVGTVSTYSRGKFKTRWVGKLRSQIVTDPIRKEWRFKTEREALMAACRFQGMCWQQLSKEAKHETE